MRSVLLQVMEKLIHGPITVRRFICLFRAFPSVLVRGKRDKLPTFGCQRAKRILND